MVEQLAADYSKLFQTVNLEKEISPLCMSIEDMLARLDEFETLLANVKAETNGIMEHHVSSIVAFNETFKEMQARVDKLEDFVEVVNKNVSDMENTLDVAEDELKVTDYSIKGLLFKPLLAKAKAKATITDATDGKSNLEVGAFKPIPIFNSDEYFDEAMLDSTVEAQENNAQTTS